MKYQYEVNLDDALKELRLAKELIGAVIAKYPTPISGCDAQFNHLLSDRARLSIALTAMENPPFIPTSRQLEPIISEGGK